MKIHKEIYRPQVGDTIKVGRAKLLGCGGYPRKGTVLKVMERRGGSSFYTEGGCQYYDDNGRNIAQEYALVSKASAPVPAEPAPSAPAPVLTTPVPAEPAPSAVPVLVYVAGPFRAESNWGVQQNVRRAEALALEATLAAAKAGVRVMPVCPHTNTANFNGHREDLLPGTFWLAGTLELMRRCDAVLLVKGWRKSSGTRAEVKEAKRLGIPVLEKVVDLVKWIKAGRPIPRTTPATIKPIGLRFDIITGRWEKKAT